MGRALESRERVNVQSMNALKSQERELYDLFKYTYEIHREGKIQ
jgi:hypothetical protein